ncbi:GbsR/MarR family transcriptional regulator [Rhizomonospora bruguierae]|uniref:GbsR/MarR family transcriptional regulator n=1 Tax=Rhizomonospora bruguierae TaxID=1581705 RepID=UPI001BCF5499|nr:MarR family transcriptional regulator [Micromonospora sp. NBRC 107566]
MPQRPAPTSIDRDQAAVTRFIERFAQMMVEAGMPRIASRIFVAILAADSGRLTAADLADQLRASAGAISGGVRYLIQVRLITREREPGSRRDHYTVGDDIWYHSLSQRDQMLRTWIEAMRDGAATLGGDTPAGARFAESAEFYEFMLTELESMLERWHRHRAGR